MKRRRRWGEGVYSTTLPYYGTGFRRISEEEEVEVEEEEEEEEEADEDEEEEDGRNGSRTEQN